ncbi:MAG TPA: lmo0937 family membrane protein [Ktedonobacteraceae bacterium]|nr:lmo0937 family membrane protein [Ktedonobacteraceae bacterium]
MLGALWGVVVFLVALWLVLWLVVHVGGALIHLLLVLAIIILIYNLIAGGRTRRTL